jgi:hypothetical protein
LFGDVVAVSKSFREGGGYPHDEGGLDELMLIYITELQKK